MIKDIKTYNAKGQAHGYWESYWFDDYLMYKCIFNNGKEIGYEEYYGSPSGKIKFKTFYL